MSWPSFVVPLKNSTFATVPSESEAVAARFTVAGGEKVAPFVGCVSATARRRVGLDVHHAGDRRHAVASMMKSM